MRADQLLVARQLAATRSQAQRLIAAGVRWRLGTGDWQTVRKSGDDIPPDAQLELLDEAEARYVSRGGLKLEGALAATGLDVTGWRCLDVGQSTVGLPIVCWRMAQRTSQAWMWGMANCIPSCWPMPV